MENELYHYGVKGMKWGVRRAEKRQARAVRKLERTYEKAGASQGRADYIRTKGRREANEANKTASELESYSKDYAARGKKIRSKVTKAFANSYRNDARAIAQKAKEDADYWMLRKDIYNQRADKIASKKNVSIGKDRIRELRLSGRRAGREYGRFLDEAGYDQV